MDPRFSNFIKVWVNQGYLKHGGMAFQYPGDQKPDQEIWRSTTLFYLQLGHVMERLYMDYRGEFSYTLLAVHNQMITMFSSCLLGFLAMRLIFKSGMPFCQAVILGLGAQTVYQTFPFNLNYIWGSTPHVTVPIFFLSFLVLEEGALTLKSDFKRNVTIGILIFLMVVNGPAESFLFLSSYYFVKMILFRDLVLPLKKIMINAFSFIGGIALIIFQYTWVKSNFPEVKFFSSNILTRSGFDGSLIYYHDHMDLLSNRYLFNLPGWHGLLFLGTLAVLAVITLVQRENKSVNQQTVLLSLLCLYALYAFLLSQYTIIHIYIFDNYFSIPIILALFTFLPALLESRFLRFKHSFVILFSVFAFTTSGLQMLTYWIQMPPLLIM